MFFLICEGLAVFLVKSFFFCLQRLSLKKIYINKNSATCIMQRYVAYLFWPGHILVGMTGDLAVNMIFTTDSSIK